MDVLWSHRKPSLFQPVQAALPPWTGWDGIIEDYIYDTWSRAWSEWGMTKSIMKLMLIYWMNLYKATWGFGSNIAWTAAKARFVHFMATSAAAVAVPVLTLWVGVMGIGLFYAFLDFLEGQSGHNHFAPGRLILRYNERLWWGGVLGHPARRHWVVARCKEIGAVPFHEKRNVFGPDGRTDWWFFEDTWVTLSARLLFWYVYTMSQARLRFVGLAHSRGFGYYDLRTSPDYREPWDWPIGWGIREFDACEFVGDLDEKFTYQDFLPGPT